METIIRGVILHGLAGLTVAAVAVTVVVATLVLAGRGPAWRDIPALGLFFFFVALTQFPLPDRETMTCPVPAAEPAFVPGYAVRHMINQAEQWGWRVVFLYDRTLIAVILNFVICLWLGLALAWQGRLSDRAVLALAAAMTLGVELTQLTGTWGYFPCAYRMFAVDDLILNFAGVGAGLWWGRRL